MTYAKVVQATRDLHDHITDTVPPVTHLVFHNPAALHAGHRVLDSHFLARDALVLGFLRIRECPTTWFLGRLLHLGTRDAPSLEPHILVQDAAGW